MKVSKNEIELKPEYDFSQGIQGKYFELYQEGSNLVRIDARLAEAFPDSDSVNKALKKILKSKGTAK